MPSVANARWKRSTSASILLHPRSWPSSGGGAFPIAQRSVAFSPRWVKHRSRRCAPCFSKTWSLALLSKEEKTGGLWDRQGTQWVVFDVDGTRQAARQRALPCTSDLPPAQRRLDEVCAPGYLGRKRGETVRTRTTVLQAHTHQWLGTFSGTSGAGNGDYRGEMRQAEELD